MPLPLVVVSTVNRTTFPSPSSAERLLAVELQFLIQA
jgi:hypothetical protein